MRSTSERSPGTFKLLNQTTTTTTLSIPRIAVYALGQEFIRKKTHSHQKKPNKRKHGLCAVKTTTKWPKQQQKPI